MPAYFLRTTLITAGLLISGVASYAQSFSCNYGKRAACLDYGDKVCNSFAKCVSSDAVCFDSYTCNYKGFVCKSTLDEIIEEHEKLVSRVDDLEWCLRRASDMDDVSSCMRRF